MKIHANADARCVVLKSIKAGLKNFALRQCVGALSMPVLRLAMSSEIFSRFELER